MSYWMKAKYSSVILAEWWAQLDETLAPQKRIQLQRLCLPSGHKPGYLLILIYPSIKKEAPCFWVFFFLALFSWVGFITSSHVRNGNCMRNPRGFCSSLTGKRFSFCYWHWLPLLLNLVQSKVIELLCVLSLKRLLFDSHWTVNYINCFKGSWVILVDFWSCFITAMLTAWGHLRTSYGQMQLSQNHLRLEAMKGTDGDVVGENTNRSKGA